MKTWTKGFVIASVAALSVPLAACGGGGDEDAFAQTESAASDFDESRLPADFPRNLIPQSYDSGDYYQLGPVEGASFENRTPVGETIDYYVGLLGAATINVNGDDGGRTAQWHEIGPWALAIVGDDSESIIGFTRTPN